MSAGDGSAPPASTRAADTAKQPGWHATAIIDEPTRSDDRHRRAVARKPAVQVATTALVRAPIPPHNQRLSQALNPAASGRRHRRGAAGMDGWHKARWRQRIA
jgi:hypothetical protein